MDSDDSDGDAAAFQLLVLLVLTLVNAFFAGAEMAVVSVDKGRIRERARCGDRRACLLEHLFEDSTKFLSTIQVAITLAGFFPVPPRPRESPRYWQTGWKAAVFRQVRPWLWLR